MLHNFFHTIVFTAQKNNDRERDETGKFCAFVAYLEKRTMGDEKKC